MRLLNDDSGESNPKSQGLSVRCRINSHYLLCLYHPPLTTDAANLAIEKACDIPRDTPQEACLCLMKLSSHEPWSTLLT